MKAAKDQPITAFPIWGMGDFDLGFALGATWVRYGFGISRYGR
jgi:hypothetical protein